MAYPFAQCPTVKEFVAKVKPFGAELKTLDAEMVGPRGPVTITYLERQTGDTVRQTEPLPEDLDERLFWDTIRRLCRQLDLDPKELDLGLDLG